MLIYFLGIAGAGVSALASVLKSEGHEIIGSDEGVFPPISDYLDSLGIKYATSFDVANIPANIDLAIIGTTAKINPQTNPEYKELLARGIKCYTFAEFLGEHTKDRENLVVAGSFGKSSLTALITHILKNAGKDIGWFIGAIAKDLPQTGHWGKDNIFIMEGDEYVISPKDLRSKFETYHPKNILISSIVHDHVNMFPTMESYEERFFKLIELLPQDGKLFACDIYEPIHRLVKKAGKESQCVWYSVEKCDGFYAQNIKMSEVSSFELVTPNNGIIELKTKQLGLHNIENVIAAAAYVLTNNLVTIEELQDGVLNFQGVARRLDKKTKTSKIAAYEGFGSSYEKARSAIDAIKLHFPQKKCVVVFEPHTFSWRNKDTIHWFDNVFDGVDLVYMLPPPTHGAGAHHQSSHDEIIERTQKAGVNVIKIENANECLESLKAKLKGDEVILLLSSGPLDGLAMSLPKMLDASF